METEIHQRIEEDEKSKIHSDRADAYFLKAKKAEVKSLLTGNQISLHHEQVKTEASADGAHSRCESHEPMRTELQKG